MMRIKSTTTGIPMNSEPRPLTVRLRTRVSISDGFTANLLEEAAAEIERLQAEPRVHMATKEESDEHRRMRIRRLVHEFSEDTDPPPRASAASEVAT